MLCMKTGAIILVFSLGTISSKYIYKLLVNNEVKLLDPDYLFSKFGLDESPYEAADYYEYGENLYLTKDNIQSLNDNDTKYGKNRENRESSIKEQQDNNSSTNVDTGWGWYVEIN